MIRIGIDVGGTNTDAVVMEGNNVIAGVKAATTADVMSGVVAALKAVLEASKLSPEAIDVVMIGTTHFTNAVVQRRDLARTAAVRLGLPATASLPPMVDWPEDLKQTIGNHGYLAHGGNEFDGRIISPLDRNELLGIAADIKAKGINTVAITSVFSPVSSDFEKQAGAIFAEALPGAHITLSNEIGRIGLLERENAAIMNACLRDLSAHVIDAFSKAIAETGIRGKFFLTQNDGTLMGSRVRQALPGADLRLGAHQLDARRGVSVGRGRCHRGRHRRHNLRCRLAAQRLSAAGDGGGPKSAVCAPISACPTCSRSGWAAARSSSTGPMASRSDRSRSATASSPKG